MDWGHLQTLVDQCVQHGMTIELRDVDVHFDDWRESVFGGRAAIYVPFEKRLYVNEARLAGTDHVHELGHAVWTLLVEPIEQWHQYRPLWKTGRDARLLSDVSRETVEDGWAEDFVAFWCQKSRSHMHRYRLMNHDLTRYRVIEAVMRRLGADVEKLLS